jgi:hypothetical protein
MALLVAARQRGSSLLAFFGRGLPYIPGPGRDRRVLSETLGAGVLPVAIRHRWRHRLPRDDRSRIATGVSALPVHAEVTHAGYGGAPPSAPPTNLDPRDGGR